MIKFGYLEGYNLTNIPKFNTATARDNYFNVLVEYSDDAYYPPYFTNVIKVDINTVPQTSPINFIILVHNSKYYYYFITHIEYKNEEIYEIHILQDTILTYMYDYKITEGNILRSSIKRWDSSGYINRNYIRENLSKGEFLNITNNNLFKQSSGNQNSEYRWLLLITDDNNPLKDNNDTEFLYWVSNSQHSTNLYFYLIPIPDNEYKVTCTSFKMIEVTPTGNIESNEYIYDNIYNLLSDTHILYAKIIDNALLGINITSDTISSGTLTRTFEVPVGKINFGVLQAGGLSLNISNYYSDINKLSLNIDTGFRVNNNIGVYFNSSYCPQLLDENYMSIKYGTSYNNVETPLSKMLSANLSFKAKYDIINDKIALFNNIEDPYSCRAIFDRNSNIQLTTDLWKQYANLYSSTLSVGREWEHTKATTVGITKIAGGVLSAIGNVASVLSGNTHGVSGAINDSIYTSQETVYTIMNNIDIDKSYDINKDNLEAAPNEIRQGDNYLINAISNSLTLRYLEYKVTDFDTVARQMEYHGYKVNEEFRGNSYACDIINNRYYYNYISISVSNYSLECIIPNDIINDINQRLYKGLRFFDTNNLGNETMATVIKYDNVENDYIEE